MRRLPHVFCVYTTAGACSVPGGCAWLSCGQQTFSSQCSLLDKAFLHPLLVWTLGVSSWRPAAGKFCLGFYCLTVQDRAYLQQ